MGIDDKTILVTGGTGFLGAAIVNKLLSINCNVNIISLPRDPIWRIDDTSKCKFFNSDLRNIKETEKTINKIKPELIFHLAGIINTEINIDAIYQVYSMNFEITKNLLLALKDYDYDLFINTGTGNEYGSNKLPFKETDRENPKSPYSASKTAATSFCEMMTNVYGNPIITVRPFLVYGPKQISRSLIPSLIYSSLEKKKISLTPCEQIRDFIYIDDVTDVYIELVNNRENVKNRGIFNIGSGIGTPILRIINLIRNKLNESNFLIGDKQAILPDSEFVCLYVNGEFEGLYLLAEKINRRLFDLDDAQNNIDSSLIFQVKYFADFREYNQDRWEQDWPNEDENIYIKDEILTELTKFVNNSDDDEFFNTETGIYTKFERLNLIDFFIYNFYILHIDFWYKNYFIIRNTNPNKFYLVPWDFDGSLGQLGWELHPSDSNQEGNIIYANRLFERLITNDDFMNECKNRWFQLRETLWTDKFILDMLSDIFNDIKEILEYEMNKWKPETVEEEPDYDWPDFVIYSTKEFDLDEYLERLFEFIPERLDFCDIYFSYD